MKVSAEFPAAVEEAAAAAAANPRLPDLDLTDLPFVTIDPESSMDLDQAMFLERAGDGFVVHYAIADLAAFITPGDPIDEEANRRGETLYGADSKVPLHPKSISEDAGSLLPDQVRPALVWRINVDSTGEGTDVTVERALVKSRAKLSYAAVQADLDAGTADEMFTILRELGELRLAREAARGGVSLPLPEQEIVDEDGVWHLEFRSMLPVESWNAQISLLTGFGAASLMVYARVGLLRTLPPADPRDVQRLHRTARALKIDWPAEVLYPDFIRSLDVSRPNHAAMVVACTRLLRGSGYVGFNGELPDAGAALGAGLGVRPRHRAAAPPRRPLRPGDLRRPVRRRGGARLGAGQAAATCPTRCASRGAGPTSTRTPSSTSSRRPSSRRGWGSRSPASSSRSTRRTTSAGEVTIEDPAIEAAVVGLGAAAARAGRDREADHRRRDDAQGRVHAGVS